MLFAGFSYLLIPWAVLMCSFIGASYIRLSSRLKSGVDHFTAGVILAAMAVELLPEIMQANQPLSMSVGFLLGTAVMLALKWFSERERADESQQSKWPWGFILPVAIDLFVDGWLIVLALQISLNAALVLSLALSLEMLSLGASVWMMLRSKQNNIPACFTMAITIGLSLLLGGFVGFWSFGVLSSSSFVACLSFGVAALLYLAAEELLVEAHAKIEDGPGLTSLLFLGVWFILLFRHWVH